MSFRSRAFVLTISASIVMSSVAGAQQPVRLSALISAFLVDSGVQTRGLPWTTGATLPIRWKTPGPVPTADRSNTRADRAMTRGGTVRVVVDDSVALPVEVELYGAAGGLSAVSFNFTSLEVKKKDGSGFFTTREMIEAGLRHDGVALTPLKCKREVEGASYGNLVDAVKTPGKTASGLWWSWQSAQQELSVYLTLLYRRADMAQVECYSG